MDPPTPRPPYTAPNPPAGRLDLSGRSGMWSTTSPRPQSTLPMHRSTSTQHNNISDTRVFPPACSGNKRKPQSSDSLPQDDFQCKRPCTNNNVRDDQFSRSNDMPPPPRMTSSNQERVVNSQVAARGYQVTNSISNPSTIERNGIHAIRHDNMPPPPMQPKTGRQERAQNNVNASKQAATPKQSQKRPKNTDQNNSIEKRMHLIFCFDQSGSMRTADVQGGGSENLMTRWDACFDCADDFLTEQLKVHANNNTDIDDSQAGSSLSPIDLTEPTNSPPAACQSVDDVEDVAVSAIVFNDTAHTIFKRLSLCNDNGRRVRDEMRRINKKIQPRLGTQYGPAFQRIQQVASASAAGGGQVMVIFLSDGRPADLQSHVLKSKEPIPPTYNYCKKKYPSAGKLLDDLRNDHGDRLSLQFLCIFDEGKSWMKELAKRYNGTFHMSTLSLEDDNKHADKKNGKAAAQATKNEETDICVLGSKSAETQRRERLSRAAARGDIVEIDSSSMRTTFRAISTVMTAMRTSSMAQNRLRERNVILNSNLQNSTSQGISVKFEATKMVMDQSGSKFILPKGEKPNGRIVSISTQPFAQGGLRNVYRMTELPGPGNRGGVCRNIVAKESRHIVQYAERLRFHCETSLCQARATHHAKIFNNAVKRYEKQQLEGDVKLCDVVAIPRIRFLKTEVYRLKDPDSPGGFRYLAVEERLRGTYKKYNSNTGYVLEEENDGSISNQAAQAFSHFTYEKSDKFEIVVDIQGCENTYTDPQLHSTNGKYGCADRRTSGMTDFFKTHKCNACCAALKLTNREQEYR